LPTATPGTAKFALQVQDLPGSKGAVPAGERWRIVVVDRGAFANVDGGVPAHVFDPQSWSQTLAEGSLAANGDLNLSESQQRDVLDAVSTRPGRVWLLSGLTAMPMTPARWNGGEVIPEKVLDALNFTTDGRGRTDWFATG
jgi:type VI secretion system secreted protein VgrG